MRFRMDFRTREKRPAWNPRVAEEVRLPTWTFEAAQQGSLVFVRSAEHVTGGDATARLFLTPASMEHPAAAQLDVAVHGRWSDEDEAHPPIGSVQDLVDEAEALLVLLGCVRPRARFEGAERTRT